MYVFLQVVLPLLVIVHPSLSEGTTPTNFEGRWVSRPPIDEEFSYAVYIVMSQAEDETCSGSLITLEWVLTAARCMYKDNTVVETNRSLTVYARVNRNVTDGQKRKSMRVIIHDIEGMNSYFSLALVKVESPFDSTWKGKTIKPLFISNAHVFRQEPLCTSGSYGRIEWDKERPVALKKTVSVIQTCSCFETLQEAFPQVSRWVCGEYEYNIGLCKGDFGATLECGFNFRAIAIDIVSFVDLKTCEILDKVSKDCSKVTSFSVYTEVCHHLDWIHYHVPTVPNNTTACDDADSAISVHINKSRHSILYFAMCYFIMVSFVS